MALGDYTPTPWVDDTTPAITATTLGHLETKVDELDSWDAGIEAGTSTVDGVKFPATQVPSADVNTLDDYEEGTWVPVYSPTTGAFGVVTYDVQTGKYTIVGNRVDVQIALRTDAFNIGTGAGNVRINIPFASSILSSLAVNYSSGFTTNNPDGSIIAAGASISTLYYKATSNGNSVSLQAADLANAANSNYIYMSGSIFI